MKKTKQVKQTQGGLLCRKVHTRQKKFRRFTSSSTDCIHVLCIIHSQSVNHKLSSILLVQTALQGTDQY